MAKRVVTFGEIMMRLNPEGYLRLVQADKYEVSYAGGEANVAVSLANYGLDAAFVSKLLMRLAIVRCVNCAAMVLTPRFCYAAGRVWGSTL